MDMNALLAMAAKKNEEDRETFKPIALTEGNVQAIWNQCLASDNDEKIFPATLFPTISGYNFDDSITIHFKRKSLDRNEQTIRYLFGQLAEVHCRTKDYVALSDFEKTYTGENWTSHKAALLMLLYLGVSITQMINPFDHRKGDVTSIHSTVKPTLSPKDPNFPAWWEEHKAEWETEG